MGDFFGAYGEIVELRPSDRYQYKYHIIDKEAAQDDKCRHAELLIALEEIIEVHQQHQWEIRHIPQTHQFREPPPWCPLGKEQGGLTVKQLLFPCGEEMIQIG